MSEAASAQEAARAAALRLLARREHTRRELSDKLRRRGHDAAAVEQALGELSDEGLLDEARFAEAFVRSRIERGQGPVRIAEEMRRRGVGGEAIDAALEAAEVDWIALARRVREHRFGAALPEQRRELARQSRFLQQRGFTAEQVRRAAAATEEDDERGPYA